MKTKRKLYAGDSYMLAGACPFRVRLNLFDRQNRRCMLEVGLLEGRSMRLEMYWLCFRQRYDGELRVVGVFARSFAQARKRAEQRMTNWMYPENYTFFKRLQGREHGRDWT